MLCRHTPGVHLPDFWEQRKGTEQDSDTGLPLAPNISCLQEWWRYAGLAHKRRQPVAHEPENPCAQLLTEASGRGLHPRSRLFTHNIPQLKRLGLKLSPA